MNHPSPHNDDTVAVSDALLRDAGRVRQPPFDAPLHHATMRRIRALASVDRARPWWKVVLPAAAVIVAGLGLTLWHAGYGPSTVEGTGTSEVAASPMPLASAWAYRRTAAQGDEALMAMLYRDAGTLLPPSAAAFSKPLN